MEPNFNDGTNFAGKPFSGNFPGRIEIDQMLETPKRVSHHRRAQSETFFRLPDDFLFDADVDFNLAGIDIPSLSMSEDNDDSHPMAVETAGKSEETTTTKGGKGGGCSSHFRSLSVGSEFFEGFGLQATSGFEGERFGEKGGVVQEIETRGNHHHHHHRQHRHSNSMDGSCSSFEVDPIESAKKAMGPDKLAELARIDPKRAKRILANRQSAARSKERKIHYTSELERKVQTLQTEATTLSAQVTMLQRDTSGLTTKNKELKMRLQAMEQEAHLRDALNDALKEEVQRLKIATGQVPTVNGNSFNRGRTASFLSPFSIPQNQQHQQFNMSQSSTSNQSLGGQSQHKMV